jgi:type VI protein secretion system component VasK
MDEQDKKSTYRLALLMALLVSPVVSLISFWFGISFWIFLGVSLTYNVLLITGNTLAKGIWKFILVVFALAVPFAVFSIAGLGGFTLVSAALYVWFVQSIVTRIVLAVWMYFKVRELSKMTDDALAQSDKVLKETDEKMEKLEAKYKAAMKESKKLK